MQDWLKIKTAGLPRWAWIGLLSGGVVLGLYLRSRSSGETESDEYGEGGEPVEGGTGGYGEGGLAGAGLVGPAGSTSVPVSTPYIPEGVTSMFESLAGLVGLQGESLANITTYLAEHPTQIIEREMTGGGTPEPGFHESTPPAAAPGTPQTKPKATCPPNVRASISNRNDKIQSANGEIAQLAAKIQNLTNNIQAHPKANAVNQWKSERDQAQNQIANKRGNVQNWQQEVANLKQQNPACA